MCWSEQVSLGTVLSAAAFSVFLLFRRRGVDVGIALFALVVALMQLGEYWMWRGLQDSGEAKKGARVGILSLLLQPLVLGGVLLVYLGFPTFLPLFALVWFFCSLRSLKTLQDPAVATPGPNGHLVWNFLPDMSTPEFLGLYWPLVLGAWFFLPTSEAWMYGIGALVSVGVSKIVFPVEWGTLWCWWANLLPLQRILMG